MYTILIQLTANKETKSNTYTHACHTKRKNKKQTNDLVDVVKSESKLKQNIK